MNVEVNLTTGKPTDTQNDVTQVETVKPPPVYKSTQMREQGHLARLERIAARRAEFTRLTRRRSLRGVS